MADQQAWLLYRSSRDGEEGWWLRERFPELGTNVPHQGLRASPKVVLQFCPRACPPACIPCSFRQERDEDTTDFFSRKNKKTSHTVSSFSTSAVTFQKRWTKDLWSLTQDASRYRKMFSRETSETVTRNHSLLIPRQRAARTLQATAHGWASHSGLLQIPAWWCSLCFLPVSVGWNRKLCFKRCGFVPGQHQEAVPGNKRVYSSQLPW